MQKFNERFAEVRKKSKMTQSEVAEKLNVSFQAVSLWERGETMPDIEKLPEIAALSDRLFDENRMYTYVKTYATVKNMTQTMKVLPYARELHEGQYRKGKDKVPYIYHPLLIACHGLSLGLDDDNLISTALLHDVCEDCGVSVEELPVNEETKTAVALLTKGTSPEAKTEEGKNRYYTAISENKNATIVKLLDRCNNVSGMATAFDRKKLIEYIKETEQWFYPLLQKAKTEYPMYSNQLFLIKYHMTSVVEAIKHLL